MSGPTRLSDSPTRIDIQSETEKAHYILDILLFLRRAATPEELSSLCRLFSPTPEQVISLCSIPASPLAEDEQGLVTVAVAPLLRNLVPHSMIVMEMLLLSRFYPNLGIRKRKKPESGLESPVAVTAKKRLLFRNEDDDSIENDADMLEDRAEMCDVETTRQLRGGARFLFDLNLPQECSNWDALKNGEVESMEGFVVGEGDGGNSVVLGKAAEMKTDFLSADCQSPEKSYGNLKGGVYTYLPSREGFLVESLEDNDVIDTPEKDNQNKVGVSVHPKVGDTSLVSTKRKRTRLPEFDDFIIEEEEGSGGYGTVYRARRKNDGKKVAIKCPHAKAHKQHVDNERKILERFGGRSFIIKYEGSFRSDDSECFILEHVEHERPEVLKKKIDIFELQWYGYCMFRALVCMHKQGVVHRDIKPGNFLFSRKLIKGYLIDFNLAKDLSQNYAKKKLKSNRHVSFGHVPLPRGEPALPNREKKFVRSDLLTSKKTNDSNRNVRLKTRVVPLNNRHMISPGNKLKGQHADHSGLASTKDVTNRTQSAERVREPLPCLGRKELINLAQDVILSLNHDGLKSPASRRKRIAATPANIDSKLMYTTPMSLHFTGSAVSSATLLKSKGGVKQKREGPCAGTKGFRAPEVLLRSLHQGPKVDVWSAGVTLLYLMIGKTPFTGDREQNIKDIAKLKGSEELWEVAKLHDREASFPVELFDVKSLPSMKLQSWCKAYTRRPEFFNLIPRSLFDLVDKCLTVNPRLRTSAEEALSHEFFASCHKSLAKQRMSRQVSVDTQNVAQL